MTCRAFLSYARTSDIQVESLAEDVEDIGHVVWFDRALMGGQDWWDTILDEIDRCDLFVACVSGDWLQSQPAQAEWHYAQDLGKPVLLVVVEPGFDARRLPSDIATLHYLEYEPEDKAAYKKLEENLRGLQAAPPLPSPLPNRPEAPISELSLLAKKVQQDSLDPEAQYALFRDLRRHLRRSKERDTAIALMEQLRDRLDTKDDIHDLIVRELEKDDALRQRKQSSERAQWMVKDQLERLGSLNDELGRGFECIELSTALKVKQLRGVSKCLERGQQADWAAAEDWKELASALSDARNQVQKLEGTRLFADNEHTAGKLREMAETLRSLVVRAGRAARGDGDEDPVELAGEIQRWLEDDMTIDASDVASECAGRTKDRLEAMQKSINSLLKVLAFPEGLEAANQGSFSPSARPRSSSSRNLLAKTRFSQREPTRQGSLNRP